MPSFRDGVYFVPLATVVDTRVMWQVLADTLGASTDQAPESMVPGAAG